MKIAAALFAFSLSLSFSLGASAQTNVAVAEKLFREAQDAMKADRFGEACSKFDASNRADPQLGTLLNLAACREKEGKPASAWAAYTTLVDLAQRAGDMDRVAYARQRAASLEPTLPQLQLRVPAGATLTEVKVDDQALATSALATTIPIDPGAHTLGFATETKHWSQRVTIETTGTTSLDVRLPADSAPPLLASPLQEAPHSAGMRIAGIVISGVGAASLVAGGFFGAVAIANKNTVDAGCNKDSGLCTSQSAYDATFTARTTGWISTATFIAGGVLLATGVILYIVGAPKKASTLAMLLSGQVNFP
jgi:hypothetical protein